MKGLKIKILWSENGKIDKAGEKKGADALEIIKTLEEIDQKNYIKSEGYDKTKIKVKFNKHGYEYREDLGDGCIRKGMYFKSLQKRMNQNIQYMKKWGCKDEEVKEYAKQLYKFNRILDKINGFKDFYIKFIDFLNKFDTNNIITKDIKYIRNIYLKTNNYNHMISNIFFNMKKDNVIRAVQFNLDEYIEFLKEDWDNNFN